MKKQFVSHWMMLYTVDLSKSFLIMQSPSFDFDNKKKEAVGQLVSLGSIYYYTYTCDLSTWSSSTALTLSSGMFILKEASRLDAFSAYPVRT